jgi:type I restriction enzyme S subunit
MLDKALWKPVRLETITSKIGSGATPKGGKESYQHTGISLIRSLNVYDFHFDKDGLAHIDKNQAEQLASVTVEADDILLNITGASVARCCMVPKEVLPARVNQHVAIVRVRKDIADPAFVFYCLNSPRYKGQLLALAQGGATREALTKETIENFKVLLPALPLQQRLSSVLRAYDELIENNLRRMKLVKNIADTIFKGARTHSGKFWNLVPISTLYAGLYDGPHATPKPSESGPIFLGIQNVTERGDLDLSSIRHIAEPDFTKWTRRVLPTPGDIVFTYEATLHRYGMIREGFRGCLGRRLALIRPDLERVDPYFLLYSLLDEEWRREVTSKIISGATVDRVPLTNFPRFQLCVPTLAVQREIGASIRACEELADNCSRRNGILRTTRDLLLPRLISGEVSVERVETEAVAQGV